MSGALGKIIELDKRVANAFTQWGYLPGNSPMIEHLLSGASGKTPSRSRKDDGPLNRSTKDPPIFLIFTDLGQVGYRPLIFEAIGEFHFS